MATMCTSYLRGYKMLKHTINPIQIMKVYGMRTLYTRTALGIDAFEKTRDRVHQNFIQIQDKFKQKMTDFCAPGSKNMVFTEDLKNMIYLANESDQDMTLVENMVAKFNQQNKELRFGSFVFGPVVMRMYYSLNKPLEALKIFKNQELSGFFDQIVSYQLLMDLLYNNNLFDEVIEVFDIVKSQQLTGTRFHKHPVILALAACYRKNTPESFEYAKKLWNEIQEAGHVPGFKAITFAAGLAVAQNAPHIALEMLSSSNRQNYVTVRNLKVASLADLNRPEDAFPILRKILEIDVPVERKQTFSEEAIEKLRQAVQRTGNKDLETEFNRIDQQLTVQGHIAPEPLSTQLCSEIHYEPNVFNNREKDGRRLAASFGYNQPQRSQNQQYFRRREGLADVA